MSLTVCDVCGDEITETACPHRSADLCADCNTCRECAQEYADAWDEELAVAGWKGELS